MEKERAKKVCKICGEQIKRKEDSKSTIQEKLKELEDSYANTGNAMELLQKYRSIKKGENKAEALKAYIHQWYLEYCNRANRGTNNNGKIYL